MTGVPSTERIWTRITTQDKGTYLITSKQTRDVYFIYKLENDKAVKLGKHESPTVLEQKYIK